MGPLRRRSSRASSKAIMVPMLWPKKAKGRSKGMVGERGGHLGHVADRGLVEACAASGQVHRADLEGRQRGLPGAVDGRGAARVGEAEETKGGGRGLVRDPAAHWAFSRMAW